MMINKHIQNDIKNSLTKFVMSALVLFSAISIHTSSLAAEQALDRIAAIVNNDVIMLSEVRTAALKANRDPVEGQSQQDFYKEALESLILERIQIQKAKSIGIKIDDAAVDTAMQTIAKQNNLDLPQLRIAIIKEGLNYKDFRESLRDRLYSDSLKRRQQGNQNTISEIEVDDLIKDQSYQLSKDNEYKLIDILIPNKGDSVGVFNLNLQRAQRLRTHLLLDKKLSSAEISKIGAVKKDLGWQNAETLSPIYSRTLSLLGKGELSEVFRDNKGLHILKLVDQRGGVRKEITEAKVRHILISKEKPNAKLLATQLRNKILAGSDFSKLAKQHSADKGSAQNGGELPMTNTSNYVPAFKVASNTLPMNTISQPIQTQFGWHILEVLDRKTSDNTREAIKNQAKKLLGKRNREEGTSNWLKTLREEAYVEYR